MKIRTIILITLLVFTATVFAQQKPFQFGFKGAANIGWFGSDADGYSNEGVEFGGSWGFAADIFLMDNYSFTTGFDVLYLNSSISYPDQKPDELLTVMVTGNSIRKYKTKYLEVPLVFTMKTNDIGKLRYFAQIGFGLGFLLSAKADETFVADDGSMQITETVNAYDDLRFTRESFIIGAGIEIPIQGSTYVRTGLKFDNAFVNVLKGNNSIDSSLKNNGRNSFMELNVSVFF